MKIILSRKGFDSSPQYGRIPSPILPDGTLLSLPIPANAGESLVKYSDLENVHGHSPAKLIKDLTKGKVMPSMRTHLDPDLRRHTLSRDRGWQPLFGPHPKSHTHLKNQCVEIGDLILFFGYFRNVELDPDSDIYHFVGEHLHVLFGWLQIDKMLPAGLRHREDAQKWALYHPHYQGDWDNNYVYVARKQLSIPGLRKKLPGGGAFEKYSDVLRLTAPDCSRSIWQIPRGIYPKRGQELLSYHSDKKLWSRTPIHTRLQTRPKWQEAVLDSDKCPEVITWARQILTHAV